MANTPSNPFTAAFAASSSTEWRMPLKEKQVSFRVSPLDVEIIRELVEYYGVSQGGLLAMLVRDRARSLGYTIDGQRVLKPKYPGPVKGTVPEGSGGR